MQTAAAPTRDELIGIICSDLTDLLEEKEVPVPDGMGEATSLIGNGSLIDSLGFVSIVTGLEQRVEDDFGAPITIVDERAMSLKSSPFRTIGTLAGFVLELILEEQQG